jgi:hypothetical protein
MGVPAATWSSLGTGARLFRIAHGVWGVFNMAALGNIWISALRGRPHRYLRSSIVLLGSEGVALVVGRGNCPFGPMQRSMGDPVPMFEWFLPPRAAKAAIPILAAVTLGGFAALLVRFHGR